LNTTFSLPSDYAAITFHYRIPRPPPTKIKVNYRKLQDVDLAVFGNDISGLPNATSTLSVLDDLVSQYTSQLETLLDTHLVTLRPQA
jgi:hypothetical protein